MDKVIGNISPIVTINGNITYGIGEGDSSPIYEGTYDVIPLAFQETTLETKNKKLIDDISIQEIPYYETSNLSGGSTVYIADQGEHKDIVPIDPTDGSVGVVGYITPQAFGAKGDGITDDTEAIQNVINSDKAVYFPCGRYLISNSIVITNKKFWNLYAQDAKIIYSGDEYAFKIINANNCKIHLGLIVANNGGGVEFYSDNNREWNQYVTVSFEGIQSKTDCIMVNVLNDGWCNENRIYGGCFISGENGVHILSSGIESTNGWKFYNCEVAGTTNGFLFEATNGEESSICNSALINCNYSESTQVLLKTVGYINDCVWFAPKHISSDMIDCSSNTTRFEIYSPIRNYWESINWHRGCIVNGVLMGEIINHEEANQ